jgi:hypothetical protein
VNSIYKVAKDMANYWKPENKHKDSDEEGVEGKTESVTKKNGKMKKK